MRHFYIEVAIQAPPERVWAIMSDIGRWHEWTPTVTSIEGLDPGPLGIGTRLLIRQPRFPPAVWQLTGLEPGRRFDWVTRGPGVQVIARHGVEAEASGSRARLSLEFTGLFGGLLGRLTRGLNDRYLALEAAGLKQRAEG